MSGLAEFKTFTGNLQEQDGLMPVLFIGHGSPMNGIENNAFSTTWAGMARDIPQPKAVLVVSAHWFTRGTHVTAMDFPKTIHDFGGFPQALFDVQYPAPGDPALAAETASLIHSAVVGLDHDWGLDHGAWTVVRHMYPQANIPVLQLSIDYTKAPEYHYQLAGELYALRKKGVLVLGSGNMVHNLQMMSWEMINGGGYDWALEMNERFKSLILNNEHQRLLDYQNLGREAMLAIPTPEHYLPLMYTLGLQNATEPVSLFNDKAVGGSLTMTSVRIG
ncbi:4,5-DOPA-extradiol-dioxygenase [Pedobacter africanus]|uniref:Aromatic ring-opening dioxygenase, catalytic subunit, LigB family n=1 Tax=Pedobacter africanus TaxID=151894 RepID=A0A1W2B917_9SPHI|nr:4,5-DOPA dioxygenase extradiol [Pedobacter africanus]SMC69280.1 Aromatic ring-opening dioxygenase, catalytic subunit, LigB family [Pedobacter africanus]